MGNKRRQASCLYRLKNHTLCGGRAGGRTFPRASKSNGPIVLQPGLATGNPFAAKAQLTIKIKNSLKLAGGTVFSVKPLTAVKNFDQEFIGF